MFKMKIMEILIQGNPPIDIGFGVHNNFKVYKIAIIFVDFLLNFEEKALLIGFGIPFIGAIVFHFKW
jgi:hypothetical protein